MRPFSQAETDWMIAEQRKRFAQAHLAEKRRDAAAAARAAGRPEPAPPDRDTEELDVEEAIESEEAGTARRNQSSSAELRWMIAKRKRQLKGAGKASDSSNEDESDHASDELDELDELDEDDPDDAA
jgi:hypothetical protein